MAHEVLHILGSAQPEGSSIARVVGALAHGLDPSRYRIHACFLAGDGPLVGVLERAGVPTCALDWWRGARDPVGAWKFWRRLRPLRIDIVHIHFGGRSVRSLARAATGAKIVMHLHSRILEPQVPRPVSFSARGADAVVAASQAVARCVVDGRARVIYAGEAPPSGGSPAPSHGASSEIIVGTAGRLIALKGIEHLLRAAAALQGEFPGLRVEIAGAGPHRQKLEQTADQLGLRGRVEFLGWVDDMHSVLPRWDVFVMPSLEEGFPIAALDAMAAGLPVIASAVGGVPELVVDGETGWLVPPADVETLASRLRSLLLNPEHRLSMGAAAQARVRNHFNLTQMTENFSRLYDELLGEPGT
jgi:glycosyltransferase involved in cell wall biosynthesis